MSTVKSREVNGVVYNAGTGCGIVVVAANHATSITEARIFGLDSPVWDTSVNALSNVESNPEDKEGGTATIYGN
jgi:hypothetical protein